LDSNNGFLVVIEFEKYVIIGYIFSLQLFTSFVP